MMAMIMMEIGMLLRARSQKLKAMKKIIKNLLNFTHLNLSIQLLAPGLHKVLTEKFKTILNTL
jgi:hypothetical protein